MKKIISLLMMLCITISVLAWKPIFAGHRGSYKGVSNTAEAYINGVDVYGYTGLECDVRVTKDKQYVIMHDETTNSLGGSLNVATSTLEELKAETLTQTRGGVTYTGKICTIGEYLDICNEKNAFPLVELKWTTGINNSDMSNFPGLMQLIESKDLKSKVIFLTSMKSSIEYIRTNYPDVTCQFLTGQYWESHFDWCIKWNVTPSIQAGYFDIHTTKKFYDAGLKVAVWTVNDASNYKKYGDMGVYMMTCDYLNAKQMPELENVKWTEIPDIVDPIDIETKVLWKLSATDNNLPLDFPLGGTGKYATAQQAAYFDGIFYINDYSTSTLLTLTKDGFIENNLKGTNSHGIAVDGAGNLILRNDGITETPNKLLVYKKGETVGKELTFNLINNGQANFIFASGDIFSPEGGYIYIYPNGMKYINTIKITNGEVGEVTSSAELSTAGSTAGMIFPIGNDPNSFIYQVRNVGFYQYKAGVNKGDYLNGSASTKAPARNSSLGGAFFTLGGHDILVHPSGANYNGGISIKDMSSTNKDNIATFAPLGTAAYAGNPSTGCFIKAEEVNENTYNLFLYCMGNGIAAYEIKLKSSSISETIYANKPEITTIIYPNPSTDIVNIKCNEPIKNIKVYNSFGMEIINVKGNENMTDFINFSNYSTGIYFIKINNQTVTRIIKQ